MSIPPEFVSLLHHVELHKIGWWERAIRQAVVAELWRQRPHCTFLSLHNALQAELGLQLDREELRALLQALERDERQVIALNDDRYKLTEDATSAVTDAVRDQEELDKRVRAHFQDVVRQHAPKLVAAASFDDFLQTFLIPLVEALGASTWGLLLTRDAGHQMLDVNLERFVSTFEAPDERAALQSVVLGFMDPDDDDVRRYVLRLLIAHFFVQATGLDRYSLEMLQKELQDLALFLVLDTDVFLAAILLTEVGLHASVATRSIAPFLQGMASENFRLYVAYPSLRELKEDIALLRSIKGRGVTPERLSRARERRSAELNSNLMRESPGQFDAAAAYYEDNLELIARGGGIESLDRPTEEELLSLANVGADLRRVTALAAMDEDVTAKTVLEWEHDVALWHIVETRRGPAIESVVRAEWWLVTDDSELMAFDQEKAQESRQLPICLHPSAVLQMMQFFVPREITWERSIVELLRHPAVLISLEQETEDAIVHVLSSLDRWERSSGGEHLAEGLANDALRQELALTGELRQQVEAARSKLRERDARVGENVAAARAALVDVMGGSPSDQEQRKIESVLLNLTENIVHIAGDNRGSVQLASGNAVDQRASSSDDRFASRDRLISYLEQLGLDTEDIAELQGVMDDARSEGDEKPDVPSRVATWLGRISIKYGDVAASSGAGAVGGLVARAIAGHYGLSGM